MACTLLGQQLCTTHALRSRLLAPLTYAHMPGARAPAQQVRDELIDAVCKREMGVYTQIFSTMGETAKLERTVNRHARGLGMHFVGRGAAARRPGRRVGQGRGGGPGRGGSSAVARTEASTASVLPAVLRPARLPACGAPCPWPHPRPRPRPPRRYKWLLKRLEARREVWSIFPQHWALPALLCIMFCNITKTQLAEILDTRVRHLLCTALCMLRARCAAPCWERALLRCVVLPLLAGSVQAARGCAWAMLVWAPQAGSQAPSPPTCAPLAPAVGGAAVPGGQPAQSSGGHQHLRGGDGAPLRGRGRRAQRRRGAAGSSVWRGVGGWGWSQAGTGWKGACSD